MEPPILETRPCLRQRKKKDLSFDDLTGPVKQMAIPQHGPQNKLTKLYNHGHKISKRFTQADYSNIKAHTHLIKQVTYSDICCLLSFSSTSLVQMAVVSLAKLHKRPEALARYCMTSYWQAEWVKKLGGKQQSYLPPPPSLVCLQTSPVKLDCPRICASLGTQELSVSFFNHSYRQP